jgi:hypothetical protein
MAIGTAYMHPYFRAGIATQYRSVMDQCDRGSMSCCCDSGAHAGYSASYNYNIVFLNNWLFDHTVPPVNDIANYSEITNVLP